MIAAGGEHHVMPLFFQVISEIKALGVSQCFETILLLTDSCMFGASRDACDDARLLDGKALLRFVADSRLSQIEEKKDRKEFMKKVSSHFFMPAQTLASERDEVLDHGHVVMICLGPRLCKQDEEQFFEAIKKHVQRLEAIEKEKEDRKERLKHETIATLEQQVSEMGTITCSQNATRCL